jgi:hypothetical protein
MRISVCLVALMIAGCGDSGETGPIDAAPPTADANMNLLSQAGLYRNFATREIAPDLIEFAPTFALWSDGLVKRRWLRLPPGTSIDTSDMDHWIFPVGTQLWKEFRVGNGEVLETRLIERVGVADYRFGAYIWNAGQTEAVYTTGGQANVLGTDHDVPSASDCINCHRGEQGRILGFSAIQLDPALFPRVSFTVQPRPDGYRPTWTDPLGYLHANCGNCHNPNGSAASATTFRLRINVAEVDAATPDTTDLWTNMVGVNTDVFPPGPKDCGVGGLKWQRVAPHDLACSAVYARMMARGSGGVQMPPIASEHADTVMVDALAAWINSL